MLVYQRVITIVITYIHNPFVDGISHEKRELTHQGYYHLWKKKAQSC